MPASCSIQTCHASPAVSILPHITTNIVIVLLLLIISTTSAILLLIVIVIMLVIVTVIGIRIGIVIVVIMVIAIFIAILFAILHCTPGFDPTLCYVFGRGPLAASFEGRERKVHRYAEVGL